MQNQPSKLMPAVWGGVLIGIISGVPGLSLINCMCCIGVVGGGILAAFLYRRDLPPAQPMMMSDGAALGLLSGIIGAIISSILNALFGVAVLEMLYQMSSFLDNPELQEVLDRFGPKALAGGFFIIGLLANLVIYCIFGLLGGMLGVTFFGKAQQPPSQQMPNVQ